MDIGITIYKIYYQYKSLYCILLCCASNPKVSPMRDYKSKRKHKTTSYANTSINPKRITLELRSEQAHDHWPYSSQSGLTVTGNRN